MVYFNFIKSNLYFLGMEINFHISILNISRAEQIKNLLNFFPILNEWRYNFIFMKNKIGFIEIKLQKLEIKIHQYLLNINKLFIFQDQRNLVKKVLFLLNRKLQLDNIKYYLEDEKKRLLNYIDISYSKLNLLAEKLEIEILLL